LADTRSGAYCESTRDIKPESKTLFSEPRQRRSGGSLNQQLAVRALTGFSEPSMETHPRWGIVSLYFHGVNEHTSVSKLVYTPSLGFCVTAVFLAPFALVHSMATEDVLKELLEAIAKVLVDYPEDVQVRSVEGQEVIVLELRVHSEDLGKVIGRQGRIAQALRTIFGAAGRKLHKRVTVEIID
jgi:uncharacterized protein